MLRKSIMKSIAILFVFSSCLQPTKQQRIPRTTVNLLAKESKDSPLPSSVPVNTLNYFQDGENKTSSSLLLSINFINSFLLRGSQVDEYIRWKGASSPVCLSTIFTHSTLTMTAYPRHFIDFKNNTKEYYYIIFPQEGTIHETMCPREDSLYSLKEICTDCNLSRLISTNSSLSLLEDKTQISQIEISYLGLQIQNTPISSTKRFQCTSDPYCRTQSYDCCSEGVCVVDRAIKRTVDPLNLEYLTAVEEIKNDPSRIIHYGEFFHLCSQYTIKDEGFALLKQSDNPSEKILKEKEELFHCTTLSQGEMSVCTKTIPLEGSTSYETHTDDRNFLTSYRGSHPPLKHSITSITLVETDRILFEDKKSLSKDLIIEVGNDDLSNTTKIKFLEENVSGDLKISYKIDGSCREINDHMAACTKFYIEEQNLGRVDDHYPASNQFELPYYVDTSQTITVTVDGEHKNRGSDWNLIKKSRSHILFVGQNLMVSSLQKVQINFFVNLNAHKVLESKGIALNKIKRICQCADLTCRLKPLYQKEKILDYVCDYPQVASDTAPIQQTVQLNVRTVPVRFFDQTGTSHSEVISLHGPQEGVPFKYIDGDLLKPNNKDQFIGFNEIYGTPNLNDHSPLPAKEVRVTSGKSYDIFVDKSAFTPCYRCGKDYYNSRLDLFPNILNSNGGGFTPDKTATDRFSSPIYRSDDLIFGRACFVPATMLPWSHKPYSRIQRQRLSRLEAQHFLFTNGLHRDWYGFDYGSVIGSFDGVIWFSIGERRRITAKSNKLFLAINAYFGDLSMKGNYSVHISESSHVYAVGTFSMDDYTSSGAECQSYHRCETDVDCASTLGWDYSCELIENLTSDYPRFDGQGNEIPDELRTLHLSSLTTASTGGSYRCVYRGAGAPCHIDYSFPIASLNYTKTKEFGLHSCMNNHHCHSFNNSAFNTKIMRYGKSLNYLNKDRSVEMEDKDTFGLATPLIGRPQEYKGTEDIPSLALNNLRYNQIKSICLPGKDPDFSGTLLGQHSESSPGDKTLGMGSSSHSKKIMSALSSCAIFDSTGHYFYKNSKNFYKFLDDPELVKQAASQALSTNALQLLENIGHVQLLNNFDFQSTTKPSLESNRCLRAAGSPCFSNLDCAPSSFISDQISHLDPYDPSLHKTLNMYELLFWQEPLICSQKMSKIDPNYNPRFNKCCREGHKEVTVGTFKVQAGFQVPLPSSEAPDFDGAHIAGLQIGQNSSRRYSRNSTISDLAKVLPLLQTVRADACLRSEGCYDAKKLDFQFTTIDSTLQRTCCTKHWVRQFHKENGGGHTWNPDKTQNIDVRNFKCLNWTPSPTESTLKNLNCEHFEDFNDPDCGARQLSSLQVKSVENWISRMELLGIPQITILSESKELFCHVDLQHPHLEGNEIIPGFINKSAIPEYDGENGSLLSGDDPDNFDSNLKQIFSPDTFNCCLPVNSNIKAGSDPELCCTGFINPITEKCALPDFSNVSLYFNRYVTSEASHLPDSYFDPQTGFITNIHTITRLACLNNICASNNIARGLSYSNYKIEGFEERDETIMRFIDGDNEANNFNGKSDLFESGLRWSQSIYCIPKALADKAKDTDLYIINCKDL